MSIHQGEADEVGYRPGEENHNTVRFAPLGDPRAKGALAITLLTFDESGSIIDADVILNGGPGRPFAVLGDDVRTEDGSGAGPYDLQNVATHEAGHFFGLGEELKDREATMFITSARRETKKRSVDMDDEAGIRALYSSPLTFTSGCSFTATRPGRASFCALGRAGARRARVAHEGPQDSRRAADVEAMNTRPLLRTALALVVAISIPLSSASADGAKEASRIEIAGEGASLRRSGSGAWTRATPGARLGVGAEIQSGAEPVTVHLANGAILELQPEGHLVIGGTLDVVLGRDGTTEGLRVELRAGEVLAKMPRRGGGRATLIGNGEALVAVGRGGVVRARRRPPPAGGKASLAAALYEGTPALRRWARGHR